MERKSRSSRSHDEESSLWKQICSSLIKLEGIQKDEESVLNTINKIQLSVNVEKGVNVYKKKKKKKLFPRFPNKQSKSRNYWFNSSKTKG